VGGCRGDLCEKRPGAALCWTQPAATDPPLAKAEPIRKTGGTSVKTRLRKGQNPLCSAWGQRGESEKQPHTPQ